MKICFCVLAFTFTLVSTPIMAGGVLEMSARQGEGQAAAVMERIYAQDGKLRIDTIDGRGSILMTMLYQDDELIQIGHRDRTYRRINRQKLAEIKERTDSATANIARNSGQMAEAMQQMQQQMANMPPEQRRMMESMLQGKLPGIPQQDTVVEIRVEDRGMGRWRDYSCHKYEVHLDSRNRHELCAALASEIEGAEEIISATKGMLNFNKEFRKALPQVPFGHSANAPYELMGKIEGFPVIRREFNDDRFIGERFLSSAKSEILSEAVFSIPGGYTEEPIDANL